MRSQLRCMLVTALFVAEVERSVSLHMQEVDEEETDKPEKAFLGPKLWTWYTSTGGRSCSDTCSAMNMVCSESALANVNTGHKLDEVAKLANSPCDGSLGFSETAYPVKWSDGQCAYTHNSGDQTDTCAIATGSTVFRFCPCHPIQTIGNPHMTNIGGVTFDILQSGPVSMLRFPSATKTEGEVNYKIRVDANVQHSGIALKCSGYFIKEALVQGSLINQPFKFSTAGFYQHEYGAVEIRIGDKIMRTTKEVMALKNYKQNLTFSDKRSKLNPEVQHKGHRVIYASAKVHLQGVELEIFWTTGFGRQNSLDIRVHHLKSFGKDWGGLLGNDDHTLVSKYDPSCNNDNSEHHVNRRQQLAHHGRKVHQQGPMGGTSASLD